MDDIRVLIDIGSTYTKATAVDLSTEQVIATARAQTTVSEDVTIGLLRALDEIERSIGRSVPKEAVAASSSAAGGLRMVSVGLVPELSSEAAKRAALGAGAKIVGHYCYRLTSQEIEEIRNTAPDIVLLAGGTDGGNEQIIVHNASALARSELQCHVVVAGNKCAYDEIRDTFAMSRLRATFAGNVMPAIGKLEVEPSREAIRDVFLHHIVHAKGLDRARQCVDNIIMPTPVAVLEAAALLSAGHGTQRGFGDLIVVDVGGATTDVYSIADGSPTGAGVTLQGLPEPHAKRTVEGDLGVRHNIDVLADLCRSRGADLDADTVERFHAFPGAIPANRQEQLLDYELGRMAVTASFERHVGRIETHHGIHGPYQIQSGKDLSAVTTVIGTGGPIVHSPYARDLLAGVLSGTGQPNLLKPRGASFYLDELYILYAIGLLAQTDPAAALGIGRKHLQHLME